MRRTQGRRQVAVSLALILLIVTSLSALFPLLDGYGWWIGAVAAASLTLVAAALARAAGWASLLASACAFAAAVVTVTAAFAAPTALVGLVPTTGTLTALRDLALDGGRAIYAGSIPVVPGDGILFLVVTGTCVLAVVVDLIALTARIPAATGLIAVGIVVVPSLMTGDLPVGSFVAAGAAYLIVLLADGWHRKRSAPGVVLRTVGIAAVASVVAGAAVSTVPGFYGGSLLTSSSSRSFGTGVSPLIDLGKNLQQLGGVQQFRYTTTAEEPPYFRLLTLDSYDGTTWVQGERPTDPQEFTAGDALSGAEAARDGDVQSTVQIEAMRDRLLPVPFAAERIDGLEGTWQWNEVDMTVRSRSASTVSQRYTVTSSGAEPSAEALAAAGAPSGERFEANLELGEDIPDIITRTLHDLAGEGDSEYDTALAIQNFLRGGSFSYSLSTPVQQGYDGDSLGVIATFLERRSGYCIHFASTMAVMARVAGIPSRIVLGYLPGDRLYTAQGQAAQFSVDSDDLHAWPELYFDGIGWVAFEPTPGRGSVPDYAPVPEGEAVAPVEPELPRASGAPTPTPSASATDDDAASAAAEAEENPPLGIGILGAGILLLVAAPWLGRMLRTRRRLAHARAGDAEAAWRELIDTAVDLGGASTSSGTPRSSGAALRDSTTMTDVERAALDRVVSAVERHRFGPGDAGRHPDLLADTDAVISALWRNAAPHEAFAARAFPRSMFRTGTQRALIARR